MPGDGAGIDVQPGILQPGASAVGILALPKAAPDSRRYLPRIDLQKVPAKRRREALIEYLMKTVAPDDILKGLMLVLASQGGLYGAVDEESAALDPPLHFTSEDKVALRCHQHQQPKIQPKVQIPLNAAALPLQQVGGTSGPTAALQPALRLLLPTATMEPAVRAYDQSTSDRPIFQKDKINNFFDRSASVNACTPEETTAHSRGPRASAPLRHSMSETPTPSTPKPAGFTFQEEPLTQRPAGFSLSELIPEPAMQSTQMQMPISLTHPEFASETQADYFSQTYSFQHHSQQYGQIAGQFSQQFGVPFTVAYVPMPVDALPIMP